MLTFSPLLPSKNKTRPPPARRAASTCRRASRSSRRSTAGTWRRRRLDERRHCDSEKSMSARRRRRRRRRGQDIFLQRETAMGYTWTAKRAGVLVEVLHHLIFLPCRALAHPFFGLGPPWALACESRNHALCRPPRRIGLGGPQPSCVVQPQTPPPPPKNSPPLLFAEHFARDTRDATYNCFLHNNTHTCLRVNAMQY